MNGILAEQLAVDFCTDAGSVRSRENVFTVYEPMEGRRIFEEGECFLKAASVNGKILATGNEEIIRWMRDEYGDSDGAWFMDMDSLRRLENGLSRFGLKIGQAHPFYIAEEKTEAEIKDCGIRIFTGEELEQFRGDGRFDEAFIFRDHPKDEIGVGAYRNGRILGMAGATGDSRRMWQIGINVMPGEEGRGIGTMLVTVLKNEVLDRGRLPFYGTAMSHIASQKVALKAGFLPAWSELYCVPMSSEKEG